MEKRKSRKKIKRFTQHNIATPILASLLLPLAYVVARTLLDGRVEGEAITMSLAFQYLTLMLLIFTIVRSFQRDKQSEETHKKDLENSKLMHEKLIGELRQDRKESDKRHREMIERWDKCDQEASERHEKLMQLFQQDREKSDAKHREFMDYIAKRDKRGRFRKHR